MKFVYSKERSLSLHKPDIEHLRIRGQFVKSVPECKLMWMQQMGMVLENEVNQVSEVIQIISLRKFFNDLHLGHADQFTLYLCTVHAC